MRCTLVGFMQMAERRRAERWKTEVARGPLTVPTTKQDCEVAVQCFAGDLASKVTSKVTINSNYKKARKTRHVKTELHDAKASSILIPPETKLGQKNQS